MELESQVPEQPVHHYAEPPISRRKRTYAWIKSRFAARNERNGYSSRVAKGSLVFFASLAMLAAVLGMPTGFGIGIDILVFLSVNFIAMSVAVELVSFLFALMYVPLPRKLMAAFIYAAVETYLILYFAEFGIIMAILFSVIFTLIGLGMGYLLALFMHLKIRPINKAAIGLLFAAAFVITYTAADWTGPAATPQRELAEASGIVLPDAVNPAEKGAYAVQAFTYGSGYDKHRKMFGENIDIQSVQVDASSYITKWSKLKTWFWGFDERELPLNGRVWMPKGDGPFPLTLIVHGNHLMEDFSDGGYGYLGELLASKGIIAVSVDENFLNYSVWSGIPNNDMKVRAWVLLKHLQQIKSFHAAQGNPLSGQVDFGQVALIGHSRGGQAVAMAADADRWFSKDQTLDSLSDIAIQSVVAIAPTDKQVDDKSARLSGVNYLTLQGARDADVNNFYGDRQYGRTTFSNDSNRFKAALYIADANHSQFNSAWGRMDERPPGGLFLNRKELLQADEQRLISKVYVSAFLQATLLGESSYKPLFADYRYGLAWLPETSYSNRYEASDFEAVTRYDDGQGKTLLKSGGMAAVSGMTNWNITAAEDRDGNNKGTKGMELEWDAAGAQYELELPVHTRLQDDDTTRTKLVFSMANLERDIMAEKIADASEAVDGDQSHVSELPPLPAVEIEVTTSEGERAEVELAELMPVTPPAYTSFMTYSWLEDRMKNKKYKESTEPVFQTFTLPLEQFGTDNTTIAVNEIKTITFRFLDGPGKIMLDDIGFAP
ncbi:dienelactone hydrolase [Paenibacillus endophyticus]|uniref:Dienelactone hydrolase n=1 Tax=Paenibacillus endophyticus TaxID=1294268 RepID=A0A7W5G9L2_9BACL|nr:alpha/beta hydrolase [Paenibacillus endophyticus]MBB3151092.1 dienelactone hydrolase [Paenibacillus endophyticus]